jgi:hypothetical protein
MHTGGFGGSHANARARCFVYLAITRVIQNKVTMSFYWTSVKGICPSGVIGQQLLINRIILGIARAFLQDI